MGVFPAGMNPSNSTMNVDTDGTFPINDDTVIPTEKAVKTYVDARQRKAWVSGALKNGAFIYVSQGTTSGGSITFWLTDTGNSGGAAVFTNIYSDSVAVSVFGSGGNYQTHTPTVAGDKKSVTISLSQISTVLGLLTFNSSAANGIDCRLYVMGD